MRVDARLFASNIDPIEVKVLDLLGGSEGVRNHFLLCLSVLPICDAVRVIVSLNFLRKIDSLTLPQ